MKIGIVGSGPTAWAVYKTLENSGHTLILIDTNLDENDPHTENFNSMLEVNKKLYFNSDLPYRQFPHGPSIKKTGVNPINSFTSGGFSLIWGATMLPYSERFRSDWFSKISNLNEYYHKICELMPVSGKSDSLSEQFGDFFSRINIIPTPRVIRILERYNHKKNKLNNLTMGLSRLAVETGTDTTKGCIYCNKCLDGCPYNLIWNSRKDLSGIKMIKMRVLKLAENKDQVRVDGIDIDGRPVSENDFDKIFLGCGPIETFRILSESGYAEPTTNMKDSAAFYLPIYASSKLGSSKKNSFALSQLFINLFDNEKNSEYQFQLYEISDSMYEKIKKSNFILKMFPNFISKFIFSKFFIAICYLDGSESPSIKMSKNQDGSLDLTLEDSKVNLELRNKNIKKAISLFREKVKSLGLYPLHFLFRPLLPGEGVHYGSWLPMGVNSDYLGRPAKLKNIFVVDSSILPNIAAGPITFTVMANAMRIAKESIKCE